jgi:hypothetical protein
MELKEKDYLIGIWWFPLPNNEGDVMGSVVKKHETGKWHLEYRFRYHKDDKVFDSEDRKSWYDATMDGNTPEKVVFESTDKLFNIFAMKAGSIIDYFDVRGDVTVFMQKTQQSPPPWMHTKSMSEQEFKEAYPDSKLA